MLSMNVSYVPVGESNSADQIAVFDNGTFRDSVFHNLLGEEFINLAVSHVHKDPLKPDS